MSWYDAGVRLRVGVFGVDDPDVGRVSVFAVVLDVGSVGGNLSEEGHHRGDGNGWTVAPHFDR